VGLVCSRSFLIAHEVIEPLRQYLILDVVGLVPSLHNIVDVTILLEWDSLLYLVVATVVLPNIANTITLYPTMIL
jgi:hypothetical protein